MLQRANATLPRSTTRPAALSPTANTTLQRSTTRPTAMLPTANTTLQFATLYVPQRQLQFYQEPMPLYNVLPRGQLRLPRANATL